MSLGGFILAPIKTIVCKSLPRDLDIKKRLDPNTFDPQFFKYILFLHNCSLLSLCHLVGGFMNFFSANMTKIKGYIRKIE